MTAVHTLSALGQGWCGTRGGDGGAWAPDAGPGRMPRLSRVACGVGSTYRVEGAGRSPYPSWNGSRVPPVSSTNTDLVSVYSLTASRPFSRPIPLRPNPPNGMFGATTR